MTDTIVLIHGLWMTPLSWEHWIARYEAARCRVIAPAWPGLDGPVDELRRDLDAPPIIVGHSYGGAFTQVLLDRGLGRAGVAIDSAPTKGVLNLPPAQIRAASPALRNPLNRRRAVMLTPKQFRYAFTNTLSDDDAAKVYERYPVPGPGRVLFDGAVANFSPRSPLRIDYRKADRAPLLFIGGGADHTVPASVNRSNVKLYRKGTATVAYREYPGRSHYTVGQDGWEDVADYALAWARDPVPSTP